MDLWPRKGYTLATEEPIITGLEALPPWGFWLAFGSIYGGIFGWQIREFVHLWRNNKRLEREQKEQERLLADFNERIGSRWALPVSAGCREAYESGRWEGALLARIDEHSRSLRNLMERVQQLERRLGESGS